MERDQQGRFVRRRAAQSNYPSMWTVLSTILVLYALTYLILLHYDDLSKALVATKAVLFNTKCRPCTGDNSGM